MARMIIHLYSRLCCSKLSSFRNLKVFRDNHLSCLQKNLLILGKGGRGGGREGGGRMPFLNLESIPVCFCLPVREREAQ